jgi:ABC-2 type transport system permease protein
MSSLTEIRQGRELWANLTLRELRSKYKGSFLGWTWSLVNPLATMLVFSLVFKVFLKVDEPTGDPSGLKVFALFLLCGLLPWTFFANALTDGIGSLLANANLVKKVWFPRELLVASVVTAWFVSAAIEMFVLAVALLIAGNFVLPALPLVALLLFVQTLFVFGLALVISIVSVYFRDVQYLVSIGMQMWFYATPIVYPISLVHDALEDRPLLLDLYRLNPMTRLVEMYRDLLYDLRLPPALDVVYVVGIAVACLLAGWWMFSRFEGRLAEEL